MAIQSAGLFSTIGRVFGLVVRTVGLADKSLSAVEDLVDTSKAYSEDFKLNALAELEVKQKLRHKHNLKLLEEAA